MKFLCVECDEAMKLSQTSDTDDGTLSVLFNCPKCGRQIAMLTNAMETQMVRSMDLQIGGRDSIAKPMGKIRESLINPKEMYKEEEEGNAVVASSAAETDQAAKCPFPGMVSESITQNSGIPWTKEAEKRIENAPGFVKDMIRKSVEQHAKDKGYTEINEKVMDEVKTTFGM